MARGHFFPQNHIGKILQPSSQKPLADQSQISHGALIARENTSFVCCIWVT